VIDGPDLKAWLAGRTPDQLAAVLARRPDVCWGLPLRDLDDLVSRLAQPASVADAIAELPLPGFQLLHTLAALGPRPTLDAAAGLLDVGERSPADHRAAVLSVLTILSDKALAWLSDDAGTVVVNPGVTLVVDRPLALGRTVAAHVERSPVDQLRTMLRALALPDATRRADVIARLTEFLTDAERVRELVASAPAPARRRLAELANPDDESTGYPVDQQEREGDSWGRRRGLLFGGQYYRPELPVEVLLAVRDNVVVSFHPDRPPLASALIAPSLARDAAAAAATELTETVAALLDSMARSPLPALKAGGVGSREVAKLGKSVGGGEARIRIALELARALDLLAGGAGTVGTDEPAVGWRARRPSTRFADLAAAWWGLPIAPSLAQDADGKAIPALGRRAAAGARQLRWIVITLIGAEPADHGVTSPVALTEHLSWLLPGLVGAEARLIGATWAEAHALGVLAHGALTSIGRALLNADPETLLSVAAELLPAASTGGRFGSDLTVMVAGSPAAGISALLDSCADRESRGAAVVWRFSPASVRRALDEGATAADLLGGLRSIADAELPQPLTYLIGDVQRRHGSLVVQPAGCCVRSADESLLIEVAAHRSLRSLRPYLLAPTVIAFQANVPTVLAALRSAGYLPVPADERGVVDIGRERPDAVVDSPGRADDGAETVLDRLRAMPSHPASGWAGADESTPELRELATALLTTGSVAPNEPDSEPTPVEAMIDAVNSRLTPVERRQLSYAVENQVPVSITYQSASGGTTTRTISDIELVDGLLYAWCHLREDERVFSVDRVRAVSPVRA